MRDHQMLDYQLTAQLMERHESLPVLTRFPQTGHQLESVNSLMEKGVHGFRFSNLLLTFQVTLGR